MKTEKEKTLLIEQLRKMPIVEIACSKANVSRATFYRWKKNDPEFEKEADEALSMGKSLISDVAESQLISAIKGGNMRGIIFWLQHNKEEYRNKVELSGSLRQIREDLTEDEVEMLRQALELAGFEENRINKINSQNESGKTDIPH